MRSGASELSAKELAIRYDHTKLDMQLETRCDSTRGSHPAVRMYIACVSQQWQCAESRG